MSLDLGFSVEPRAQTASLLKQTHGCEIVILRETRDIETIRAQVPEADGIVSFLENSEISVVTADCLPILAYSPAPDGPIAALHCGWRGAMRGIVPALEKKLGPSFRDLNFVFGPSIGPCCFEVREDFLSAFQTANRRTEPYLLRRDGRMFFDLVRFVIGEDMQNIPAEHVSLAQHRCTMCSQPPLPSYRRQGGTDPRIRAWIRRRGP